jgi:hypothetical protein
MKPVIDARDAAEPLMNKVPRTSCERCTESASGCSACLLITFSAMGSWIGVAPEKFVRPPTFRRRFRGFSKKQRSGPSGRGDKPFADRVFRSLTRALGLIVRGTAEQENQVLGEG